MRNFVRRAAERAGAPFGALISGAILLREAARTSRRWQTYAARTVFSGALLGALLLGMWAAVNATRMSLVDASNLGWLGRGLFIGFSVTQVLLAIVIAPLTTASAVIEETDERTMEMLVLTPLRPGQILGGKVLSRILGLLTLVGGALPVMALVVNLGGVSGVEVLAVTAHTLTTVVLMAGLGAFFALFTKSPALAMMASASYAVPFFGILPLTYMIATGDPSDAPQFSVFAAGAARDPSALLSPLSYAPSVLVAFALATPLFQLRVSNADIRHAFSDDVWQTTRWLVASGGWFAVACVTFPVATPLAWWTGNANQPFGAATSAVQFAALGWLWLMFTVLNALATWAFLRVGSDVVDGLDGLLSGNPTGPLAERRSMLVGAHPVLWREARPRAWASTATPIFVTWALLMLAVFQTGWWLFPGGILTVGAANVAGAILFGVWLAARSVTEERRRGTLEVLVVTTLPSSDIVFGKLLGAALPTMPLMALGLPLLVIGVPHLTMISMLDGGSGSDWLATTAYGLAAWIWTVPVWGTAIAGCLSLSTRIARPQGAFATVCGTLLAVYGIPTVLARAFPDQGWIAVPCRIVAPPLAGGFSAWQIVLSTLLTATFGVWLVARHVRNLRRWIGAAVALVVLGSTFAATPARAEPPSPETIARLETINQLKMTAKPIVDGIAREGRFTTLAIRIDNLGPGTVGTVSLTERREDGTSSVVFTRAVELPEGARSELHLLLQPGIGEPDRLLELVTRDARTAIAPFRLRPIAYDDVSIAVIGEDPLGLPAILRTATAEPVPGRVHRPHAEGGRAVHTGIVPTAAMPLEPAGWGAVDWLVWPKIDPSTVSVAQTEAVRAWVADGGHLLVTVTDTWRQLAESPLAAALPVTPIGQQDDDVGPLSAILGHAPPPGPVPIAAATVRSGVVRAAAIDGAPLWVTAPYGLGSVHVLLVDPDGALALRGDEGAWRRLLTLPPEDGAAGDLLATEPNPAALHRMLNLDAVEPWADYQSWESDAEHGWESKIRERLSDIPGVAPLPMTWLVAFAVVYLVSIGPLDYAVLRLIGRQPWTWVTFPVLIVVFSGASLAMTSYTKGSQAMVVRVELMDLLPDTGLARGQTWLGVFSTRKTSLTITGGFEQSVVSPLLVPGFQNDTRVRAGDGPGSLTYGAETWTLAYVRSDWTAPAPGRLDVRSDSDRWVVRNELGYDLDDLGLTLPDAGSGRVAAWARLGPLAAGAERVIPVAPDTHGLGAASTTDPLEWAIRTFVPNLPAVHGSLRPESRPILVGVAARGVEPITLTGLDPVERPLLVVRQPLSDLELDVDLDRNAVIVGSESSAGIVWSNLSCEGGEPRIGQDVEGTTRYDDVAVGGCTLNVTGDDWTVERVVHPGDRVTCRRVGSGDRVTCAVAGEAP